MATLALASIEGKPAPSEAGQGSPRKGEKEGTARVIAPVTWRRWCLDYLSWFVFTHTGRAITALIIWLVWGFIMLRTLKYGPDREPYTSVPEMLYLMAQMITTVGFGDTKLPVTRTGYLSFAAYAIFACLLASQFFQVAVCQMIEKNKDAMVQAVNDLTPIAGGGVSGKYTLAGTHFREFLEALAVWVGFVVVWTLFFHLFPGEQRDFSVALYMGVVTMTTVGFGDQGPATKTGKLFAAAWMVLGSCAFLNAVSKCSIWTFEHFRTYSVQVIDANALKKIRQDGHFMRVRAARQHFYRKSLVPKMEVALASSTPIPDSMYKHVSRNDFLLFMLQDMNIVDPSMIRMLNRHFDALDVTDEGYIDESDLRESLAKRAASKER